MGAVVNPAVDPVSGEPEFKHTPVAIEEFRVSWHGFMLTRGELHPQALAGDAVTHWTRVRGRDFTRFELAGRNRIADHAAWARALLGVEDPEANRLEYEDLTDGGYRAAYVVDNRIEVRLFMSARPDLPSRSWLAGLFAQAALDESDRVGLLLGQPVGKGADAGPTVCSCFGVGRNTICEAIRTKGLKEVGEVTACLKAGGNCGSCVPEIKRLLRLPAEAG